MNYYSWFIYITFCVKIVFIVLAISNIFLQHTGQSNTDLDRTIVFWKDRIDFVFEFLMAILLIYLFYPYRKIPVVLDSDTKYLLFLFGTVLIITANWETFFKDSPTLKLLQKILSNKNYNNE